MKRGLPNIIGVTGTNGAGKDTVAKVLVDNFDYKHISLSDVLRRLADERGLEHSRSNLSSLSQEIRSIEGDDAMATRLLVDYNPSDKLCITSIRTPGEAEAIQGSRGVIIWVDADAKLRYQRVVSGTRGRQATDQVSFEEFSRQEEQEMSPTKEGGGLNGSAVRARADIFLENNFDTKLEFVNYLETKFHN